MKKKNYVLIFGIISIMILISVQVFIIKSIWLEKEVMFDMKYKSLAQEAMDQLRRFRNTDGFDTAFFFMDKYAEQVMTKEIANIKNDADQKAKKEEVYTFISKILNQEQDLSLLLSSYFSKFRLDNNFTFQIVINSLYLVDFDTKFEVYRNPDLFRITRPGSPGSLNPRAPRPSGLKNRMFKPRILVQRFTREDNYFNINFDYFIDFSDKRNMVLRDMAASLAMSIFSIIVVVIIFMITYHNLMEEKRLSNLKTDFINNMTHELKTPLSTITVAGKTLEMQQIRADDSKILETAKLIGKQSIHLNQLINLILEISMWERTQFQLDRKQADIGELMNDIVDSFKTGCGNCARITQKYELEGIKADVDIVYFTTMINNLLTNAVKYSDKEPEINIEGSKDRDHIYIKVADNGIGIDRLEQKHIFDKFYRVSSGNIHKTKGLGLGLYYVKRIAESHGGDVSVTSKPGKGSIFTVTLPY
jgi:two-component system, OmpR family, phosphate regulon sensor histidine kinase PhoR